MAIIGKLSAVHDRYFRDHLDEVFSYLRDASTEKTDIRKRIFSRPMGAFERVDLTSGIFALEQVFETKNRNDCFFEGHRKYIDFQLNLSGIEQMEFASIDNMEIKKEYDSEKDLTLFKNSENTTKILLRVNDLAVYFPEDVHMGLPYFNSKVSKVYKTVVKVPIEIFE